MRRGQPERATRTEHQAAQLTFYVAEPHVAERRSKVDQLLRRATREMAGATVLAAHQGFGRRHSHEPTMWHRVDEVPLTVIIVDEPDRVREFLTRAVREVLPDVVAVISSVRVIRYRHDTGAESS